MTAIINKINLEQSNLELIKLGSILSQGNQIKFSKLGETLEIHMDFLDVKIISSLAETGVENKSPDPASSVQEDPPDTGLKIDDDFDEFSESEEKNENMATRQDSVATEQEDEENDRNGQDDIQIISVKTPVTSPTDENSEFSTKGRSLDALIKEKQLSNLVSPPNQKFFSNPYNSPCACYPCKKKMYTTTDSITSKVTQKSYKIPKINQEIICNDSGIYMYTCKFKDCKMQCVKSTLKSVFHTCLVRQRSAFKQNISKKSFNKFFLSQHYFESHAFSPEQMEKLKLEEAFEITLLEKVPQSILMVNATHGSKPLLDWIGRIQPNVLPNGKSILVQSSYSKSYFNSNKRAGENATETVASSSSSININVCNSASTAKKPRIQINVKTRATFKKEEKSKKINLELEKIRQENQRQLDALRTGQIQKFPQTFPKIVTYLSLPIFTLKLQQFLPLPENY